MAEQEMWKHERGPRDIRAYERAFRKHDDVCGWETITRHVGDIPHLCHDSPTSSSSKRSVSIPIRRRNENHFVQQDMT